MEHFVNGVHPSKYDPRDRKYHKVFMASPPFDWSVGYSVEDDIGQILPVKDQNGSGSCFRGDTPVLMEDLSYKPISDITSGDVVISHTGQRQKVITKYSRKWQGTTKIIKLWSDYRMIEVTQEHPFYALKRSNKQLDFYQIKDLKIGDWVAYPFNNIVEDKTLYGYEKDPEFLWVLGLYLAEGCTDKYYVTFSLHKDEIDWYEKIKRIMSKYGANVTYNFKKDSQSLSIRIQGEKWTKVFSELGDNLCQNKKINKRLMVLDPSLQMNIVRGVSDGDGHYRKNICSIKSTSYEMLVQLKTILLRNGISSSFCKEKKYDGKKQAYTLEYNLKGLSRYSFIRENYLFCQIKSIKHNKAFAGGHVYNLEVENDNSYQVNGIAVHNCGGQSLASYMSVLEKVQTGVFSEKSAKDPYSQIYEPGGGVAPRNLMNIAVKKGVCREIIIPSYNQGFPPNEAFMEKRDQTSISIQDASNSQGQNYASVKVNIDTIAQAVRDNHGCLITLGGEDNGTWRSEFPLPPVKEEWAHFVYVGGACLRNGKKYLKILNSWGKNCGVNGWQYLGVDYIPHISSAWIIFDPINPKVTPQDQQKISLIEQLLNLLWELMGKVGYKTKKPLK